MQLTAQEKDFLVIDNFLSPEDFSHVQNFVAEEEFQPVHTRKWIKAFRLSDGEPLWGAVYLSHPDPEDQQSNVYPTKRGIDAFIGQMLAQKKLYAPLIGEEGEHWSRFFCRPYLYAAGSGLSWHTDGRFDIAGAYVYYSHPQWHAGWGAELLIDSSGKDDFDYPHVTLYDGSKRQLGLHLDYEAASAAVLAKGLGHYICAKPNRLVILRRGILHRIQRVDPNAGDRVRSSLTGFFLRK